MTQVVELTISFYMEDKDVFTGVILCVRPANERWCYIVMLSRIGWAHIHNGLCIYYQYYGCCCCKTKCSEYFFLLYSHLVNITAADVLATLGAKASAAMVFSGARASAAMVLTYFSQANQASAPER